MLVFLQPKVQYSFLLDVLRSLIKSFDLLPEVVDLFEEPRFIRPRRRASIVPELVHSLLNLLELDLKVLVADDRGVVLDGVEECFHLIELVPLDRDSVEDEVVAGGTVNAARLTVVLVLFASLAGSALNVLPTLKVKSSK